MSGRSLEAMREYYDRRAAEYDDSITDGLDPAIASAMEREAAALGRSLAAQAQLRAELGSGDVLFEGRFFVAVRAALAKTGSRS